MKEADCRVTKTINTAEKGDDYETLKLGRKEGQKRILVELGKHRLEGFGKTIKDLDEVKKLEKGRLEDFGKTKDGSNRT